MAENLTLQVRMAEVQADVAQRPPGDHLPAIDLGERRRVAEAFGPMTVSAGIAAAPEHGSSAEELLRAADEALYVAKQAGRNSVVSHRVQE